MKESGFLQYFYIEEREINNSLNRNILKLKSFYLVCWQDIRSDATFATLAPGILVFIYLSLQSLGLFFNLNKGI